MPARNKTTTAKSKVPSKRKAATPPVSRLVKSKSPSKSLSQSAPSKNATGYIRGLRNVKNSEQMTPLVAAQTRIDREAFESNQKLQKQKTLDEKLHTDTQAAATRHGPATRGH